MCNKLFIGWGFVTDFTGGAYSTHLTGSTGGPPGEGERRKRGGNEMGGKLGKLEREGEVKGVEGDDGVELSQYSERCDSSANYKWPYSNNTELWHMATVCWHVNHWNKMLYSPGCWRDLLYNIRGQNQDQAIRLLEISPYANDCLILKQLWKKIYIYLQFCLPFTRYVTRKRKFEPNCCF